MRRYKKGNNLFITEYNSVGEFVADINNKPNNSFFSDRRESQRTERTGGNWYATEDYARANYLMVHGWDSAAEKMATKVKMTSTTSGVVRSSKPAYGVVGSQASVPRYLQGIPTNMISRQSTYSKQKVVTVTKGISYNCGWTAEQILAEAVKALQIIQSMENGGQRVRLNVLWAVSNGNYHTLCKVCVKQPDERLNISKMSYALAHPSMLRRHFFKWLETDTFTAYDMGEFYGRPSTEDIKYQGMAENEYYVPEKIVDMNELIKQFQSGKPQTGW